MNQIFSLFDHFSRYKISIFTFISMNYKNGGKLIKKNEKREKKENII